MSDEEELKCQSQDAMTQRAAGVPALGSTGKGASWLGCQALTCPEGGCALPQGRFWPLDSEILLFQGGHLQPKERRRRGAAGVPGEERKPVMQYPQGTREGCGGRLGVPSKASGPGRPQLRRRSLRQQLGLCTDPSLPLRWPQSLTQHGHRAPRGEAAFPLIIPLTTQVRQEKGPERSAGLRRRFSPGLIWRGAHAGTGGHRRHQPTCDGRPPTHRPAHGAAGSGVSGAEAGCVLFFLTLAQKSVFLGTGQTTMWVWP